MTETTTVSTVETTVARYLEGWNETDAETRRAIVDEVFTTDAVYVDPLVDVAGRDAIAATIGAVQAQFPGLVFSAHGELDAHHDIARFRWALGPADGDALVIGFDVAEFDAQGRIRRINGFLDQVPAGL
jgi:hypothetical protein